MTYNHSGTQRADALVHQYAPLVKRIALHLLARLPASVQLDDLIQAGMIGLLEASQKYDAGKGASFETYAGIRIRGSMMDEVRKGDWVPRSVHRNARRISEAIHQVEVATGRDAVDHEVAQHLGMSLDHYHSCLRDASAGRLFSLEDMDLETDEASEMHGYNHGYSHGPSHGPSHTGSPQKAVEQNDFLARLAMEIDKLPEREKLVMALYYDEELNLKEIGKVLEVSESRVSQIHSQAAMRLKSRLADWD